MFLQNHLMILVQDKYLKKRLIEIAKKKKKRKTVEEQACLAFLCVRHLLNQVGIYGSIFVIQYNDQSNRGIDKSW